MNKSINRPSRCSRELLFPVHSCSVIKSDLKKKTFLNFDQQVAAMFASKNIFEIIEFRQKVD